MIANLKKYTDVSPEINTISGEIIDSSFQVHQSLGPGFLEINYEEALTYELTKKNIYFEKQKRFQIPYKDIYLKSEFRFDLVVEDKILVELKAVETIDPIHKAQTLAYMKAGRYSVGLLINFNVPLIKDGINRLTLRNSDSPC